MNLTQKPLLVALSNRRIDPPPIWLMRQAGRYLPEYRSLRAGAGSFLDLCLDPAKAAVVTLQPISRFGFDAAILFSDILVVPHALGQKVDFETGTGPTTVPVRNGSDLAKLTTERVHDLLCPVYETVERAAHGMPDNVALIGFAGAPWTVATYMVEGGTSRDHAATMAWALGAPEDFQHLIDMLVEVTAEFLIRQVAAGAEVLQIFDSWAGALPAHAFARYSLAPIREIAARVKLACPQVPVIAFPRGVPLQLAGFASAGEIDAVSIDHATDPRWVAEQIQPSIPVQGNLDPALLLTGGAEMIRVAREIVETFSGGAHVFNLGHGVLPATPVEHVRDLVRTVRGE